MKTGTRIVIMSGLFLLLFFTLVLVWICGSDVLPQITDDITSGLYYRRLAEQTGELVRNTDGKELTELMADGNDYVFPCWLRIDGTDIDYPVMQEEQGRNGYYLNHRPDGKKSRSGSLYIPCYDSTGEDNIIIYGHHMRNGTMFGALNRYKDSRWAKDHSRIELTVDGDARIYEVCAVIVLSLDDRDLRWEDKIRFDSVEDKKDYLYKTRKLSCVDTGTAKDIKKDTRFITLVTCDYSVPDGRLIVVAIG